MEHKETFDFYYETYRNHLRQTLPEELRVYRSPDGFIDLVLTAHEGDCEFSFYAKRYQPERRARDLDNLFEPWDIQCETDSYTHQPISSNVRGFAGNSDLILTSDDQIIIADLKNKTVTRFTSPLEDYYVSADKTERMPKGYLLLNKYPRDFALYNYITESIELEFSVSNKGVDKVRTFYDPVNTGYLFIASNGSYDDESAWVYNREVYYLDIETKEYTQLLAYGPLEYRGHGECSALDHIVSQKFGELLFEGHCISDIPEEYMIDGLARFVL